MASSSVKAQVTSTNWPGQAGSYLVLTEDYTRSLAGFEESLFSWEHVNIAGYELSVLAVR